MNFAINEMMETIRMVQIENLDIRTVTMGINLGDCADSDFEKMNEKVFEKVTHYAKDLKEVVEKAEREFGIPIINKRISITPVAQILGNASPEQAIELAKTLDRAAVQLGVDFIGGFSALVHKGISKGDQTLLDSLPEALSVTDRVCGSVSVGSTRAGINMDAVRQMGEIIKKAAERSKDQNGMACAKLVVFCNPVEDNPFMAGAFHGAGHFLMDFVNSIQAAAPEENTGVTTTQLLADGGINVLLGVLTAGYGLWLLRRRTGLTNKIEPHTPG